MTLPPDGLLYLCINQLMIACSISVCGLSLAWYNMSLYLWMIFNIFWSFIIWYFISLWSFNILSILSISIHPSLCMCWSMWSWYLLLFIDWFGLCPKVGGFFCPDVVYCAYVPICADISASWLGNYQWIALFESMTLWCCSFVLCNRSICFLSIWLLLFW